MKRNKTDEQLEAEIHVILEAEDDQALALCRDREADLACLVFGKLNAESEADYQLLVAAARLGFKHALNGPTPASASPDPLVRLGQGDYLRDYAPTLHAPNPFTLPRRKSLLNLGLFLFIGFCAGAGIAALIDFFFS